MHYYPKLPLILDTDASLKGLRVVLSHKLLDGSERIIAFASRTILASEEKVFSNR